MSTMLETALSEQVVVRDGVGNQRKLSKLSAGLTQLANKAASGDLRAIQLVIALWQGIEAKKTRDADDQSEMLLTDADRRVLDQLAVRINRASGNQDDG